MKAARQRSVARTDEDRESFLRKNGFSKFETSKVIETVLGEANRKPESIFDFVQGITAVARGGARRACSPARESTQSDAGSSLPFQAGGLRPSFLHCPEPATRMRIPTTATLETCPALSVLFVSAAELPLSAHRVRATLINDFPILPLGLAATVSAPDSQCGIRAAAPALGR
jgi:hypothetical protein